MKSNREVRTEDQTQKEVNTDAAAVRTAADTAATRTAAGTSEEHQRIFQRSLTWDTQQVRKNNNNIIIYQKNIFIFMLKIFKYSI